MKIYRTNNQFGKIRISKKAGAFKEVEEMARNHRPQHNGLLPEKLRWRCEPSTIPFDTTAEIAPISGDMGQDRALRALRMGVEQTASGYNLFVCGLSGTTRAGMKNQCRQMLPLATQEVRLDPT